MRKRVLALIVAMCLLLSGCSGWMDGSYSSVHPHTEKNQQTDGEIVRVSDFAQLRDTLIDVVESGSEQVLINVAGMDQSRVQSDMQRAINYVTGTYPIGAYAVEEITYEQGTSGGQSALSVSITYNHNRSEIRKIKRAEGMEMAREIITNALIQCESRVVLVVENYRTTDFSQFVRNYASENPDLIMEIPQVSANLYPENGSDRVVELVMTYQTSRDSLRSMQSRVRSLFTSAELYVSGNHADHEKYAQLYSFLMERNEYTIETSITPSYSLLLHGVGDSRAFAVVYAAMCRRAGLECMVVTGTCSGEPLFWNMVSDGGGYRHVDLLRCSREGAFLELTDEEMSGYVWDYSAYPECVLPEPTEPPDTEPTEPTESEPVEPEETDPTESTETEE